MSTGIQLRGVTKTFGAAAAVDDITLEIKPGELFFLLGPSGCGKTTLLRMIAGFIEPTRGRIFFDERDVTNDPANKRDAGMVFQSYALWPHMTVAQNVGFGLDVRGVKGDEWNTRVRQALEMVRMAEYTEQKPTQLSGGQQQRVALARALVIRPKVLLLDEPLSNLDAKLRGELRTEIRRVCKEAAGPGGLTAVYVTHDQKEALSIADRVAVLAAGRVMQIDSPSNIYRRPTSAFVAEFLGDTNLIGGVVTDIVGDRVTVRTELGMLEGFTTLPLAPDQKVLCGVRPEMFRVERGGRLNGTVVSVMFLGEVAHVDVLVGSRGLRCLMLGNTAPQVGSELSLAVDPHDVAVFPS